MGAIGGLLGTAGGQSGSGIKSAGTVNIQPGTTPGQINAGYSGAQNSLNSQQQLLNQIKAKQGLDVQSQVFNQQQGLANQLGNANGVSAQVDALNQQQALNNQLAANNGAANLGSIYGQGQTLANQLSNAGGVQNLGSALQSQQALANQQQGTAAQYQGIANGTGPNPAQAALNQSTGQNVANQAALMAGQRGASANVGLLARQAAQQGAATQQQAVGQGATLQAQQQLGALSGLTAQQQAIGNTQQNVANIAAQQIGQQQAQQAQLAAQAAQQVGLQQAGTNAAQQAASNITAQQQAQQQALAGQTNVLANQQIGTTAANTQAQQAEQSLLQNALASQNQQNVNMQGNVNSANAGLANTTMQGQQGLIGGGLQGAASAASMAGKTGGARGGMVHQYAEGGIATPIINPPPVPGAPQQQGPLSSFGQFLSGFGQPKSQNDQDQSSFNMSNNGNPGAASLQKGMGNLVQAAGSKFGKSNIPASGIIADNADLGMAAAKGGVAKKHDFRSGGDVKAKDQKEKAVKAGNSYSNDKIPAVLSEGEVVIPRSVMQGKDPIRGAADFVAKVMAKQKRKIA